MLILRPRRVSFGAETWSDVESISINRKAARLVTDFSDAGPHVAFADVPEQLVEVELVQLLTTSSLHQLPLGAIADLAFSTGPNASDAGTERITIRAVVAAVAHTVSRLTARRTIRLVAVSPDGLADPVTRDPSPGAAAPDAEPKPAEPARAGPRRTTPPSLPVRLAPPAPPAPRQVAPTTAIAPDHPAR